MTEAQMIESVQRMVRIYLESYPEDRAHLERFLRWAMHAWGYEHGQS
jgi:hypothetical protein